MLNHQKPLAAVITVLLVLATMPAIALQDTETPPSSATKTATPQPPNCNAEIYRQFDFWLGDWSVFDKQGNKAGDNIITREENGCLILERWSSVSGGTGQSYNYIDAASLASGKPLWRQVWVSTAATIDYQGGLNDKGDMVLEGTISYRNGQSAPFKGIWTANDDGSVRQYFEQYNTQTKEWSPWFEGHYKKKNKSE